MTPALLPTLLSQRLRLAPLTPQDADALFPIWADPEVTRFLALDPFTDLHQTRKMIDILLPLPQSGQGGRWTIALRDSGQIIGTCGFHNVKEEHRRAEIGYEIARTHWGKGLMSEALRALIAFCFEEKCFHRLEALVTEGNTRSVNLLLRNGFTKEGVLRDYEFIRGKFQNQVILSLLRPITTQE